MFRIFRKTAVVWMFTRPGFMPASLVFAHIDELVFLRVILAVIIGNPKRQIRAFLKGINWALSNKECKIKCVSESVK